MSTPPTVDLDALAERVRTAIDGVDNASFGIPVVTFDSHGDMRVRSSEKDYPAWAIGWAYDDVYHVNGLATPAMVAALRVLVGDTEVS